MRRDNLVGGVARAEVASCKGGKHCFNIGEVVINIAPLRPNDWDCFLTFSSSVILVQWLSRTFKKI